MKKHAYLVLAHNNPWQLGILLELLDDKRNDVFVLIDGKSSLQEKDLTYQMQNARVFVYKNPNRKIYWGALSLIKAELFLLEEAIKKDRYHYLHLISGMDLPIKRQEEIHSYFENCNVEFVSFNHSNLSVAKWKTERFHFFVEGYNYPGNNIYKYLRNGLVLIQKIMGIKRKREFPTYFHGSAWFSITSGFAEYLVQRKRQIFETYKNTICCDEVFVQTELIYSGFKPFVNPDFDDDGGNLRLIDWTRREGNSPYTWRLKDFDYMIDQSSFFARKIDERKDRDIILKIRYALIDEIE